MTTVNWEREPGEKVEEFVAALVLLEHPDGNLITPSRGDRGVDIRVPNPDGFDIYQVKRYTRPLTSRQAEEIEKSWSTFVRETLPVLPVRSWTLVTPWDPTNERLDWLAELTAGSGIPTKWMGRTNLDVLAAQRQSLVSYYFGDGGSSYSGCSRTPSRAAGTFRVQTQRRTCSRLPSPGSAASPRR
jgi:hypothetical protein